MPASAGLTFWSGRDNKQNKAGIVLDGDEKTTGRRFRNRGMRVVILSGVSGTASMRR